jgi:hypothetical protein
MGLGTDNLTAEGYDFIRDSYVDGSITVYNALTERYELWQEASDPSGFLILIHEGQQYEFVREISYTVAHGRCDQCIAMTIQGTVCHESGCPRIGDE